MTLLREYQATGAEPPALPCHRAAASLNALHRPRSINPMTMPSLPLRVVSFESGAVSVHLTRAVRWSVLCAVLIVASGCADNTTPAATARPVRTMVIGAADAAPPSAERYDGVIVARTEAAIGFQVPGRLIARLVNVGARVTPGMALARLDTRDLTLAVDAARAALAGTEADAATATRDLQRTRELHAQQISNDEALERITAAAAGAVARRDDARARLATAENALRYGTLVAPESGVITTVFGEVGQVVAPGQPIVIVAHEGSVEVAIDVPERRIARFAVGQPAAVNTLAPDDTSPAPEWQATVREVAPAADPLTGTYRVRLALVTAPSKPALGQTASVRLPRESAPGVVTIPSTALVQTTADPGVWLLSANGDRLQFRAVRVLRMGDGVVSVRDGLRAGDEIVIAGANRLDGTLAVRRWEGGVP
jgi:membrane fusion protein, multidrug efflux system